MTSVESRQSPLLDIQHSQLDREAMAFSQTIAMARDLLADGRAEDVLRMVKPLLTPIEDAADADPEQAVLHALAARVHVTHRASARRARDLLAPFATPEARDALDEPVRAEVALWLGWALAVRHADADETARALSLLDEAQQLLRATHALRGQCWALLGRAQAYFALDEYHLMRHTLSETASRHAPLDDAQAEAWLHDLSIPAHRFAGRYDKAQHHADALREYAQLHEDRRLRGHAWAHAAAIRYDLGRPPSDVIDAATTAVSLLRPLEEAVRYPLLAAYHAHVGALLRRGTWDEAASRLDEARDAFDDYPTGQAHLQTLRARLALRRGDPDRAASHLDALVEQAHHLPHGLHRSHVALLHGEVLAQHGEMDAAVSWMERAVRNARETGHRGNQLRALLTLARTTVRRDDVKATARYLAAAGDYDAYASVLPYAAQRLAVRMEHAHATGDAETARSAGAQAVAAFSLIGDLHAAAECADCAAALDVSLPDAGDASTPDFHATLADAAVSPRLVARALLDALAPRAPNCWMGVLAQTGDAWTCLHDHGAAPDSLADVASPNDADGIGWVPLQSAPDAAVGLAIATDDLDATTWRDLQSWVTAQRPVLRLALDAARLCARPSPPAPRAPSPPSLDGLVAESAVMRDLTRQIAHLQASHSPVLIRGESGTEKTLVARAVHTASERCGDPFEVVPCASLQRDPMAERLFGAVRDGTVTPGAVQDASGGTLLLQDVGALPDAVQDALLEVLHEGRVMPVGGTTATPVDVRLVATMDTGDTSVDGAGTLRDDLYHLLNVIPLRVPPLRERREDVPRLVRHFLDTLRPSGTPLASITSRALGALMAYDWPGNVRQLRNEIERALLMIRSEPAPTLDVGLFSDAIGAPPSDAEPAADETDRIFRDDETLSDVLSRTEASVIRRVLRACNGQVTASADVLGLSRQGLYKKMKRLEIDPSEAASETAPVAPT